MKNLIFYGGKVGRKEFAAGECESFDGHDVNMMPGVRVEVSTPRSFLSYPCSNLRRRPGGGLGVVGAVPSVGTAAAGCIHATLGENILVGSDAEGKPIVQPIGQQPLAVVGSIEGKVTAAVALDGEHALLSTDAGRHYRLTVTSGSAAIAPEQITPGIILRGALSSVHTVAIDAITLKGSYDSRNATLGGSDLHTVSEAVGNAWRHACRHAFNRGEMPGYTIGRCRVVAADGHILAMTPPLLLGDPAGGSASPIYSATVLQTAGAYNAVQPARLSLNGISITLEAPAGLTEEELRLIDHVDVLMTPPLVAVQPDSLCEASLTSFDGSECRLNVTMPGVPRENAVDVMRRRVEGVLARLGRLERVVARVSSQELRRGRASITPMFGTDFDRCLVDVESALGAAVTPAPASAGIDWSATAMVRMGDMIVAGDVTRRAGAGFSPLQFAGSDSAATLGAWSGYAATEVEDAGHISTVVSTAAGRNGAPTMLNALVAYPGSHGRRMTVCLSGAGRVDLQLRPTADGAFSYSLSSNLAPVTPVPQTTDIEVPEASVTPTRRGGLIVMASVSDVSTPRDETTVDGKVTALAVAVNSGSSLDFGRSRCVAATTGGIFMVALNSARTRLKADCIDSRPVVSHAAITVADGELRILAGRDLVGLSGTRLRTLLTGIDATAVGYSPGFRETWLVTPAGVKVMTDNGFYLRSDISPASFHVTAGMTLAVTAAGGLYDIGREGENPAGQIYYSTTLPPSRFTRRDMLQLNLTGKDLSLHAKAWSDGWVIASFGFAGDVCQPVVVQLVHAIKG